MNADYIKDNKKYRFRIYKTEIGWDYDYYNKETAEVLNYATEAADIFNTKKAALKDIVDTFGEIKSINPKERWF